MTDALKNLAALQALAALKRDMQLARLAKVSHEEGQLRQKLSDLDTMVDEQNAEMIYKFEPQIHMPGQGMGTKWMAWEAHTRRKEMTKLSQIMQRREQQLQASKRAFGRCEALEKLAIKHESEQ